MDDAKTTIEKLLASADVRIGGDRPWDMQVHDERFYRAVVRGGSLAFGEAYMAGWWDADKLDELAVHILSHALERRIRFTPGNMLLWLRASMGNLGAKSKAFQVGMRHYDIGNNLFERMLDRRMVYTCGYWRDAKDLDAAQEAKLDLVCRKLGLHPGQTVLDIGCGWGSFAKFAAERYGAHVTGITISKEQAALAQERCKGLPVEIRLEDYRDTKGSFEHVVSLGMFEHVGYKNYRTYMRKVSALLRDDGLFLLHSIGAPVSEKHAEPWIDKYIFPNGNLPSAAQITKAAEGLLILEDWHNFGADYDTTLMAWFENFDRHWPELAGKYGDTFYRMWKFYLLFCAGVFRVRTNQLWQVVFSKHGVPGGYESVR